MIPAIRTEEQVSDHRRHQLHRQNSGAFQQEMQIPARNLDPAHQGMQRWLQTGQHRMLSWLTAQRLDACVLDVEVLPSDPTIVSVMWRAVHLSVRRWRHHTRGTVYLSLGVAELQSAAPIPEGTALMVYVGHDGKLWARPHDEFLDGRFQETP